MSQSTSLGPTLAAAGTWRPAQAPLVDTAPHGPRSIGLGLAILAADWTVHALVIITGLVFIIRGIALAFSPAYAGRTSGEQVAAGIAGVIAGVVLVAWPGPSLLVLAFFVGAWLGVSGSFHIVTSVSRRRELPHWGFTFSAGVIELLPGIWAMRRPEATLALLITIIGLRAVVTGVIYCALAFEIRSTARYCRSASAPANALPADVACCCAASSAAPVISSAPCWRHPACARRVTVIWTRHRRPPDLTPQVRAWFTAAGFDELAFDALDTGPLSAVGANRLRRAPSAVLPAQPLFTFQV